MKKILTVLSIFILSACNSDNASLKETVSSNSADVVETETYQLTPIDAPSSFLSHSWEQTCGTPILNESDKQAISFDFVAPELKQDEKYCFTFKGITGEHRYITNTTLTVVAPTLEVYIDHASLPSLQQLIHIIQAKDEYPSNQRFVSWKRVTINADNASKLNIRTYPLKGNNTSPEMVAAIDEYAQSKNRLNIEFYSNTAHSFNNLASIIQSLYNKDNVTISHVSLYDDGSAEYVNLYQWKDTPNKIEVLERDISLLDDYLAGTSPDTPKGMGNRYNWHKLYNTDYYFLRKDYLDIEASLHDFRDYLGSSVKQMPWDEFAKLSDSQQTLFLDIVGFDKEQLQQQYSQSPLPNFIFTGTTTWAGGETKEFYAQQQVNVINNAISETSPYYLGEDYDLFFKGHPAGGVINDIILGSFPDMINIPAKISFEVLMMTDMLPDTVAGIASSLYFTIPADKVNFIVFTSSDTITDREEALKSPLVQVMLTLGIVKEKDVLFWADLPDCSSGVCIDK
ncbi:TPA: PKD domain-containing protein [Photobacterium damselae]